MIMLEYYLFISYLYCFGKYLNSHYISFLIKNWINYYKTKICEEYLNFHIYSTEQYVKHNGTHYLHVVCF